MVKLCLGLGAALLYGSLGAATGMADIQSNERSVALTSIDLNGGKSGERIRANSATNDRGRIPPGEMSEEEKERRKQVCVKEWEDCYDWCSRSRRNKYDQKVCYGECSEKEAECLKKIK